MNKAATSKNANKPDAWTQAAHLPGVNGTGGPVDSTDGECLAANARLEALILRRTESRPRMHRAAKKLLWENASRTGTPEGLYAVLLLQASLLAVQSVTRKPWEEIIGALSRSTGGRDLSRRGMERVIEREQMVVRRVQRAARLLDLTVKIGVFRRKEARL